MEKYGFVYIWYDKKHKRYYIGSHWGTENDGYICSSNWMKQAYKIRPQDFKRRIISIIKTNKKELLEKENYFLSLIKLSELKIKYYNLHNHVFNHWSTDKIKTEKIKKTISQINKGKRNSLATEIKKGQRISPNTEFKKGQSPWNKGKKNIYSNETLDKMSKAKKNKIIKNSGQFVKGQIPWNKKLNNIDMLGEVP